MKFIAIILTFFATASYAEVAEYQSSHKVPFKDVFMERIDITDGLFEKGMKMTIYKICLDGQAYLAMNHDRSQSLTASFVDGKPEQCSAKNLHHF